MTINWTGWGFGIIVTLIGYYLSLVGVETNKSSGKLIGLVIFVLGIICVYSSINF